MFVGQTGMDRQRDRQTDRQVYVTDKTKGGIETTKLNDQLNIFPLFVTLPLSVCNLLYSFFD